MGQMPSRKDLPFSGVEAPVARNVRACSLANEFIDDLTNLLGEQWWHSIPNLLVLFSARSFEEIVVRKCLESRRFANRQASGLRWIVMNEVMSVFGNMRGDCGRGATPGLNAKTVIEHTAGNGGCHVRMFGQQRVGKILQTWSLIVCAGKLGGKQIAVQVLTDVASGCVVAKARQIGITQPVPGKFRRGFARDKFATPI